MRKNLVSLRASYRSVWMAQQYSGGALEVGGSALVEKQLNPSCLRAPERVQVMAHINDLSAPLISHILRPVHDHSTWSNLCIIDCLKLVACIAVPASLPCVVNLAAFSGQKTAAAFHRHRRAGSTPGERTPSGRPSAWTILGSQGSWAFMGKHSRPSSGCSIQSPKP